MSFSYLGFMMLLLRALFVVAPAAVALGQCDLGAA
jgi:hypothetical protein